MNSVKTKTGDLMQVSECKENDVTFGIISIKLKAQYRNLDEAKITLIEFMQQLQPTFAIQHTTGFCIGYEKRKNKITVVDYWQDIDKKDWKVKGWTDGKTIALMYIKNISHVPVLAEERFLNSGTFARRRFL